MRINACTKTYGGRTVLRFPGLSLEPGSICAVVGANGSGKSTLARLVSGAVRPDGNVQVLESPVRVGYMPQKSFAFRLTVRRNIRLSGPKPERAEALMEACGLLILDEPTASMDMEAAILAERLVAAYREETGCAVLLITHDLQQARRMADEALFFCGGQLWESGPAERVLFAPERPETGKFLEFYGGERPSRG